MHARRTPRRKYLAESLENRTLLSTLPVNGTAGDDSIVVSMSGSNLHVVLNGTPTDMTAAEALDVARAATPDDAHVVKDDPSGLLAGQTISVTPDDTGKVPVVGVLAGLAPDRISLRRSDPRVGDVMVHFPRAGYVMAPA